jgi:hypothetical protein
VFYPYACTVIIKNFQKISPISLSRNRNWEVQAGSPDKIFDKKMSTCLTKFIGKSLVAQTKI